VSENQVVNVVVVFWLALWIPQISQRDTKNCYPIVESDLTRADPPRFKMYAAKTQAGIRPAPVALNSNPKARTYRTVLKEGAAKGPNFAGHYTVVVWGCGSSCVTFAIVDSLTGRVVFPEKVSSISGAHFEGGSDDAESEGKTDNWGLRFRLDSKLLVMVGTLNEDDNKEGAFTTCLKTADLSSYIPLSFTKGIAPEPAKSKSQSVPLRLCGRWFRKRIKNLCPASHDFARLEIVICDLRMEDEK